LETRFECVSITPFGSPSYQKCKELSRDHWNATLGPVVCELRLLLLQSATPFFQLRESERVWIGAGAIQDDDLLHRFAFGKDS
jgi:hypothetical protein